MKDVIGKFFMNKVGWVALARSILLVLALIVVVFPASNAADVFKAPDGVRIVVTRFIPGDIMSGEVLGLSSSVCGHYKVVAYVRTDRWYIHPFAAGGDGKSYSILDSLCSWSITTVKRYPVPKEFAVALVDRDLESPVWLFSLEELQYHSIAVQKWNEREASTEGKHYPKTLHGQIGASSRWGTGWMDLSLPVDFRKGDKVRLAIGGNAEKVIVRFLPLGASPDATRGFEGGVLKVPESRVIELMLEKDHLRVVQISVHGGERPWGEYDLGGNNGPATLLQVELLEKDWP